MTVWQGQPDRSPWLGEQPLPVGTTRVLGLQEEEGRGDTGAGWVNSGSPSVA